MKNQGIFNKGIYKQTPAHELGHSAFGLKHTFDPEYGVSDNPQITRALNLMGYNDQAHLAKFQWDIIHQHSGETAFDSTDAVMAKEDALLRLLNDIRRINYNDTLSKIYDQYPQFPEIYTVLNLKLGSSTLSELRIVTNPARPNIDDYVFINTSEQLIQSCEECIDDSYAKLVFTDHRDEKYPVSTGLERIIIIVKRAELPVLQNYLYTQEQRTEGKIMANNVVWVSQRDATLFGQCTGCWTSSCCRRAAEYMMGNTGMANCSDSTIAKNAPYMSVLGNITTAYFSDNISAYTKETYNSAALNYNAAAMDEGIQYIKDKLEAGRPVITGVHYLDAPSDPPNNKNRATRHFIVVVGCIKEKTGQEYLLFYEPSTDSRIDGTSSNNKLIINRQQGNIQGSFGTRLYTITEILKTN